jgi:molecular chaperone DnaK (HSP70)
LEEVEQLVSEDQSLSESDVRLSRVRVTNVTSKSFGIIAVNSKDEEVVYNLILKNTDVPNVITKSFGTAVENQEAVSIQIMENDATDIMTGLRDAVEIGTAVLQLPAGLAADTPIEITFKLNEEGRLEISAIEPSASKRKIDVAIDTRSVISGEELETAKARSRSLVVS